MGSHCLLVLWLFAARARAWLLIRFQHLRRLADDRGVWGTGVTVVGARPLRVCLRSRSASGRCYPKLSLKWLLSSSSGAANRSAALGRTNPGSSLSLGNSPRSPVCSLRAQNSVLCGLQTQVERGRRRWAGASAFPFLGRAAAPTICWDWEVMRVLLAGHRHVETRRRSCTAVMIEFGFNITEYGKTVLAACSSLISGPWSTRLYLRALHGQDRRFPRSWRGWFSRVLPGLCLRVSFESYGGRPSRTLEIASFLLLRLLWRRAELGEAKSFQLICRHGACRDCQGTDHALVRRLATLLTFGLLSRSSSFSRRAPSSPYPCLSPAPVASHIFLVVKIGTKIIGVYPVTKFFGSPR